ncbi:GT-D fold domain-containing protein [Patescibacteria group bacterium]|nr:GT-D fold domain-containing protein [Patescibacteria group bacterium]
MWRQRVKKFLDNPILILTFLRTNLYWRHIADTKSKDYLNYKFLSGAQTITAITETDRSIIRIGDGTFGYLFGSSIYFNNWQFRYNRAFAKKLETVLKDGQDSNTLFCFPHTFITKSNEQFIHEGIAHEWPIWIAAKVILKKFLRTDKQYGDALAFHPKYNPHIDFAAIKNYLDTKHIIIITSNIERFTDIKLGKSTTLIEGPSSDAWQVYEELTQKGLAVVTEKNLPANEVLFMISAAEAAKVMVYDLAVLGYTAWDTGQFFDLAAKEIGSLAR